MLRVVMENSIDLELGVLSTSPIRGNLQTQALMHDWVAAQASQMMQGTEE